MSRTFPIIYFPKFQWKRVVLGDTIVLKIGFIGRKKGRDDDEGIGCNF